MTENYEKIDFVILWVDDNDPVWQKEFNTYLPQKQFADDTHYIRYRNWDNLRYWFRGVDRFAPWVDKVHLVTCGQIPEWLNLDAPRLHFVRHSDFIPAEFLPTFKSSAIQMNLLRIEGLSEHFVLFDDDMFLIDKVRPESFFRNGLPCDKAALNTLSPKQYFMHRMVNNLIVINNSFDKHEILRNHFRKWFSLQAGTELLRTLLLLPWRAFTGLYDPHLPQVFLKSTFEEIWQKHEDVMLRTMASRFRCITDVSIWLFRYRQLAKGNFTPFNVEKDGVFFQISDSILNKIVKTIEHQKKRIVCLNDGEVSSFDSAKERINTAFQKILPEKSSFEI